MSRKQAFFLILILIPVGLLYNNCGAHYTTILPSESTTAGNPMSGVAFRSHSQNADLTLCIDAIEMKPQSSLIYSVRLSLAPSEVTLLPTGIDFGSLEVPRDVYVSMKLHLSNACSGAGARLTNSQGTFTVTNESYLTYDGSEFVGGGGKIEFESDRLLAELTNVASDSEFLAETSSTIQSFDYARYYLYASNDAASSVSAYIMNPVTGGLTAISSFPVGNNPEFIESDPLARFVYVSNETDNNVSAFSVDQNTGALIPVLGSPFSVGANPQALRIDPSGRFLIVTNSGDNSLSSFAINQVSGALAEVAGSPFPAASEPRGVAFSPDGRFVYSANDAGGSVSGFLFDSSTGVLTTISGSPFAAGTGPESIVVDPSGQFAYVGNIGSDDVFTFSINSITGALTLVDSSTTASDPHSIVIHPANPSLLVVGNRSGDNILPHSRNLSTGILTPLSSAQVDTGNRPRGLAFDPSGNFLYACMSTESHLVGFRVNASTGSLTPLATTFPSGLNPFSIVILTVR